MIFFLLVFSACSGCHNSVTPALPSISIASVSQDRSRSGDSMQFAITLNRAAEQEVSFNFSTVAGSASANTDFIPKSGIITVAPGQQSTVISVMIAGDSLRKTNQIFYVQLENPTNCTFSVDKGSGTIVNENGLYFPVDSAGYTTPDHYNGYTLQWRDEFDGHAVDQGNWNFETGNNGWGNNELEDYTGRTQNAFVSDGHLILEARKEILEGSNYTSARMDTKGKRSFNYGRIDIRAKLPAGQGLWPALWLLGNNLDQVGWPACGEMDMMELLGQEPGKVYGTLHWGVDVAHHQSKGTNFSLTAGSFNDQFHVFSMIWTAAGVNLYVDDQVYYSLIPQDVSGGYPFNQPFFFIFNVAVGGDWPGLPDGTTQFPQRMVVDYVRVFQ